MATGKVFNIPCDFCMGTQHHANTSALNIAGSENFETMLMSCRVHKGLT